MRFKLTVLLIVLNAAIFSLIFYIDRANSTKSRYESVSRLILDPDFTQGIERIQISTTASDITWELERSPNSGWIVTKPLNWKANPYAVARLIFQLNELSWESRFPTSDLAQAGQSLESYNLSEPPLLIELSNGASSLSLALGAPTEIGNRLYTLSPDGEYIMVISRGLLEMLQTDMEAFLDQRIFGEEIDGSSVIQVQDRSASNVRVRLERDESGWRFVSPIEAPADNERVQELIAKWQGMEAEAITGTDKSGLEINGNAIRLTFEGFNKRETLLLAPQSGTAEEDSYFQAKRDSFGATFQVPAEIVQQLRNVQEELREKRILHTHSGNWTSMTVQFSEISTTVQQLESGGWQVLHRSNSGDLDTQQADRAAIEKLNALFENLEAVRFVSDAPSETDLENFGLSSPQRRVTLRNALGEALEFSIGDIDRENDSTLLYAKTNLSASVFLIRPHVLAEIPLDPLYYRERTIRALPDTTELVGIQLVDRSSGVDALASTTAEAEAAAKRLSVYLMNVRVTRLLDHVFADPIQLDAERELEWPYLISVDVKYPTSSAEEQDTTEVLYLSERLGGVTQYIGDPTSGLVGTLPVDLIEILDPLLAQFPELPEAPTPPLKQGTGAP